MDALTAQGFAGARSAFAGGQRLHECLAASLSERIFAHGLQPGTAIDEAALCRHYGVSRASLLDALQLLLAEGLLARTQDGGFAVSVVSREDIAGLCALLAQVDSHALCCLAARGSGEVLALLEDCARAAPDAGVVQAGIEDAGGSGEAMRAAQRWYARLREHAQAASAPCFALLSRQVERQLQLALGPERARLESAAALDVRAPLSHALLAGAADDIASLCRQQAAALRDALC
ncbi:GntR family transcriptional regulator [Rhodocyclus tenuis]|uniref:DNA-binding GntR family transcriptional regulator n=1 Tax=Rhodocyclus tenuis TaxID=1066 RepID=A0A840G9Y0_RHOTE|nr:GntR family transcriptional regulator [Rhodocyclus tenuis]MBB4247710.1 DNA-binding GntR family transcriptional regulator [Rhodocyclus tenuis]